MRLFSMQPGLKLSKLKGMQKLHKMILKIVNMTNTDLNNYCILFQSNTGQKIKT